MWWEERERRVEAHWGKKGCGKERGREKEEMGGQGGRKVRCECSKAAKQSACDDARCLDGAEFLWCGAFQQSDAKSTVQ